MGSTTSHVSISIRAERQDLNVAAPFHSVLSGHKVESSSE